MDLKRLWRALKFASGLAGIAVVLTLIASVFACLTIYLGPVIGLSLMALCWFVSLVIIGYYLS